MTVIQEITRDEPREDSQESTVACMNTECFEFSETKTSSCILKKIYLSVLKLYLERIKLS